MNKSTINNQLKIMLVEPNFHLKNSLVTLIEQCKQRDITEYRNFEETIDVPLKAFDLIFVNAELQPGMSGTDFIQFLTRMEKVSSCCKFVLITQDFEFKLDTTINREIKTEVFVLPTNQGVLDNLMAETLEIKRVIRPIIENTHKLSPNDMVKALKSLPTQKDSKLNPDDIAKLKINVLLRASKPQLALSIASTITSEHERYRETLYILKLIGNEDQLVDVIAKARGAEVLERTCFHYLMYRRLIHLDFDKALETFNLIEKEDIKPRELELHTLLLIKNGHTDLAIEKLGEYLRASKQNSYHQFRLTLTQVRCLCWILLSSEDESDKRKATEEITKSLRSEIWEVNSIAKQTKLFVRMVLLFSTKSEATDMMFQKLYKSYLNYNIYQLNALMFIANKLGLEEESLNIHLQVEKRRASMEMSSELLNFQLMHLQVLKQSMTKEQQHTRLTTLARKHWQEGRPYRAIEVFLNLHSLGHEKSSFNEDFEAIKQQLEIQKFWVDF